ncbi:MAG: DNA starvation/stationary phase protection protein [Planctomycetes bacterium]|nr:DNA starvation/stationary phase protection protein [Planctomycetota bacterium]
MSMDAEYVNVFNGLIADFTVLYQKARLYHWTVNGPTFFELHEQFERLYKDAAETIDTLAERMMALGHRPLGTLTEALDTTRLSEEEGHPDPQEMVQSIVVDLEKLSRVTAEAAETAEKAGDRPTTNMLDEFAHRQEKRAWMFRAYLGQTAAV